MYGELLRDAGLSLNEARVYEALLSTGEASVQLLSLKSRVHRRNVYDSLNKLVERGLASEVFISGEKHYKAVNPRRLLELLKEREEQLTAALPEMQARYGADREQEKAYVYRGVEGFKNYFQDILDTGETVYFIGAKAFWLDPRIVNLQPRFQRERKRRGIKFMHLFDHEVKEKKPEILKLVGRQYKFLPKGYSSPTTIVVFGDYVVTFVGVEVGRLPEQPLQFVMRSRKLADGYRKFFQFMWDRCG
ncbi:MAG: helix-turn-helix domain-containing protein [Candidatus Burarchaeum sp.]|nr:helix-turn-helix domain-containing protein [Candidatus Burarchaeum sp.]MDO8339077.1 helix-turn-helix domain-containing protein [Candidatus Burarchaeum sp.]